MNNLNPKHQLKQKGAALLILFLILFSVGTTVVLAGLNNNSPNLKREMDLREEMSVVKETLLAYALNYPELYPASNNGPGRFPCEDSTNDGIENCGVSSVSRLPESVTLGSGSTFHLSNMYSKNDRQFWYLISPNYVRDAGTPVNSDTSGGLTVDSQADDVVAVIIDSGEALSWQDRVTGPTSEINYLEADNKTGNDFINSYLIDSENFNDHVLGITRSELMSLAIIKVAQELKVQLDQYYNSSYIQYRHDGVNWSLHTFSYPRSGWAYQGGYIWEDAADGMTTVFNSSAPWLNNEGWDLVNTYAFNTYTSANFSFAGCNIIFTANYGSDLIMNSRTC